MQNIDDVQLAAIRRAMIYLNKKAAQQRTGIIREFLAGVLFLILAYVTTVIVLAL